MLSGYPIHARALPVWRSLDSLTIFLFALPSTVMGIGPIGTWNRPSTAFIYATPAIVVLGYLAQYTALGSRITVSTLALIPPSMEDAAQIVGAGWVRRIRQVIIPLARRGLLAAWLAAYIFCLRDTGLTMMVYPPGRETLPVRTFTLMANGSDALIAALSVLMVAKRQDTESEDNMKLQVAFGVAWLGIAAVVLCAQAPRIVTFDQDKVGAPPQGFSTALTGQGKPGVWVVMKDAQSPDRGNVLAQTDADPTGYRFPVCVLDEVSAKDLDLSVMFKPVTGRGDQAAGLVWRYADANNYYIVRANALENNVVLYKVQNGKRTDLPLKGVGRTYGMKVAVPSGQWGTLRVTAAGTVFTVYLNGQKLYDVEDTTFPDAGKVGVWTKADSVTYFDNLSVTPK